MSGWGRTWRCSSNASGQWLCDVGFGGSLLEPLPLAAGERHDAPYTVSLQQTDDGYWRFTELAETPFGYDFRAEPAEEALLIAKRDWQASDPASNFTLNFVAQMRHPDSHFVLRGRVLTERSPDGTKAHTIGEAEEFVGTLADRFGIDEPRAREIWPRVEARHRELFEAAS